MSNKGVEVSPKDWNGQTPLHFAAQGGYIEITKVLLDGNAMKHSFNAKKQTPLCLACEAGQNDTVKLLFDIDYDDTSVKLLGIITHENPFSVLHF